MRIDSGDCMSFEDGGRFPGFSVGGCRLGVGEGERWSALKFKDYFCLIPFSDVLDVCDSRLDFRRRKRVDSLLDVCNHGLARVLMTAIDEVSTMSAYQGDKRDDRDLLRYRGYAELARGFCHSRESTILAGNSLLLAIESIDDCPR